jgi:Flp pilus assembly protein TadG
MRATFFAAASGSTGAQSRSRFGRFRRDVRGSTALEFALVGLPFLLFCFGIIGYGLYFFTSTALEFSVESEARKIRTGQAQTTALTQADFKSKICAAAGSLIDCAGAGSKLKVHIQSASDWAGITPTPCMTSGSLTNSAASGSSAVSAASGGSRQVVLVTVCYEWSVAQIMPFLLLGNMGNGSSLIQAVATFRTEPYQ